MKQILYIIGGPSGVGKTTLIKKLTKGKNLLISTGELYKFIINEKFKVRERNLNLIDWNKFDKHVFSLLLSRIKQESKKNIILDTHFAVNSPEGFLQGFSNDNLLKLASFLKNNNFKKIVCIYISAPAKDIYKRINLDKNRNRPFNEKQIKELLHFSKKYYNSFVSLLSENICTEKIEIVNNNLIEATFSFISITKE